MKFILTSILSLFILFSVSKAQWTHCKGPLAGNIRSMTQNESVIIASTLNSGIFRSSDEGKTWTLVNDFNNSISAEYVVLNGKTLLASSSNNLFRSTDYGDTWELINGDIYIYSMTVIDTTIFVYDDDTGLMRSTDNWNTWTHVVVEPKSVSFVKSIDTTLYVLGDGKLYSSTDLGDSWTKLTNSPINNQQTRDFAIMGTTFFAGSNDSGVSRSFDKGATWTFVNNGLTNKKIRKLFVHGTSIFAGADKGLFRSTDKGETWEDVSINTTSTQTNTFLSRGNDLYVGMEYDGVFRSTDNGDTWEHVGLIADAINALVTLGDKLYAGTFYRGVMASTDKGDTWTTMNSGLKEVYVQRLLISGNKFFVGTGSAGGVYRSLDSGVTWKEVTTGMVGKRIQTLTKCGTYLFAGITNGMMYRSSNDGDNWELLDLGYPYTTINSCVAMEDTLYVGAGYSLIRSTDKGENWTVLITEMQGRYAGLTVSGATLFTDAKGGIFRSTDYGEIWTNVSTELATPMYVRTISNTKTEIFAQTDSGAVYRSTNNGDTWLPLFDKLNSLSCMTISGSTLYAGTYRESVWKVEVPNSLEEQPEQKGGKPVLNCYPNPATNALTIDRTSLQFPENTLVHYTLSTLIGGKVMEFDNSELKFTVSLEGMGSGMYSLTAVGGGNRAAVMVTVVE